jgi:hypothetical protein
MSQKSSLPQPAESVSRVLTADTRRAAAKWTEGRRNPRLVRKAHNVAAGSSESKNRPRANPVRGLGGVTGIAESSCDGDVGSPAEPTSRLCCATQY